MRTRRPYLAAVLIAVVGVGAYAMWRETPAPDAPPVVPFAGTPGGLSTSRDDLDRLVRTLETRIAKNPEDASAAVTLADVLVRKSRVDTDAQHAIRAERVIKDALKASPGNYDAMRMLGAVYLAQHRFRDAIEAATRAQSAKPKDAWNDGVLGDAYLELGDYDRAFTAFDAMVLKRPDAAAYGRVAYAHELQGNVKEALRHMRMAAEATSAHDPESLAWHYAQIGNLLFQEGDIDGAAREFARAEHAFPGHPYARNGRARVAAARGQHQKALEIYRALFDEAPTPELAANIGDLLVSTGDEAAGRAMYEQMEELEREGWKSEEPQPAALARLLADRGLKPAEAVRLAESAAETRRDINTMDALAWAYYRAGRIPEARTAAQEALRTGTRDRRILYHAAEIAAAAGDSEEARALVDKAIAGNANFDPLLAPAAARLASTLAGKPREVQVRATGTGK